MPPVWAEEQVTDGVAASVGDPPLGEVMRPVVDHVAALAEAFQVAQPVVGRVVVKVRRGKHDAGGADRDQRHQVGRGSRAASVVPPSLPPGVEPAPVQQTADQGAVRPAAALAHAAGPREPHPPAERLKIF